ncbi:MAG TPA: hypothetical protein VFO70_11770, partial [Chitinophagaceae bacterium]|nr:hypothetical protein [Chitinophagaceae bacterium]
MDNKNNHSMKQSISSLLIPITLIMASCNNNNPNETGAAKTESIQSIPTITESPFGEFEGKPVTEYLLSNGSGMKVGVINYGG